MSRWLFLPPWRLDAQHIVWPSELADHLRSRHLLHDWIHHRHRRRHLHVVCQKLHSRHILRSKLHRRRGHRQLPTEVVLSDWCRVPPAVSTRPLRRRVGTGVPVEVPAWHIRTPLVDDQVRAMPCWYRVPFGWHSGAHSLQTGHLARGYSRRYGPHGERHVQSLPTRYLGLEGRTHVSSGLHELRRALCLPDGGHHALRTHRKALQGGRDRNGRHLLRELAGNRLPSGLWLRCCHNCVHPERFRVRARLLVQAPHRTSRDAQLALSGRLLLQERDWRVWWQRAFRLQVSCRQVLPGGHRGGGRAGRQPQCGRIVQCSGGH
mmetsp:Transcript_145740/g.379044  ORF Transcript_145740/g.379044 Transcript_145740/m.379044 type:complete len:320 (+) Transcript_145740:853-1812(+)